MSALKIHDHTRDRYHALAISSVWELAKVRKARALVIGAGALGNEVCKNLAMMGVRLVVVLDRDTVEAANLSRSIFFRESDHGRPKAEVILERLRDVNPDVELHSLDGDLDEVLGLGVVRRMDMVFSCLDSRMARRSVNRMCEKLGKPWVDGAMENLLGEVAAYLPGEGPCYECSLTHAEKLLIAQAASCRGIAIQNLAMGKVPTTSTMGSIISALEVQEAVKILHGDFLKSLVGKRLVVDCNVNEFYVTTSSRREDCEGHFRYDAITEVADFTAASTSAQDLLLRFQQDTGKEGFLRLGREIVIALACGKCGERETLSQLLGKVTEEMVLCPKCGSVRRLETTNFVRGTEPYAEWPLSRLGIPLLDVLEVRGVGVTKWYELTGDLASYPASLQEAEAGDTVAKSA